MSDYLRGPDVAAALAAIERRVMALELAAGIQRLPTSLRPAASVMPGAIIFNTTTAKHEGSNGTSWNALY